MPAKLANRTLDGRRSSKSAGTQANGPTGRLPPHRYFGPADPKALNAIRSARAEVHEHVWELAGVSSPDTAGLVIVDWDGTDGLQLTAFVTNTAGVPIAALELRHRQPARTEDRSTKRCAA